MGAPRRLLPRHGARATIVVAAALVHAFTVAASTGPGFASFDTAYQWWMARHLDISTLWPPSYVLSFRLLEAAIPGVYGPTAWFGVNLACNCVGAALVAYACTRGVAAALLCYVAVAASPVSWLLLPHVWSDVALTCLLLLVIGCLLIAAKKIDDSFIRRACIAASLLALFVATGVRHNAVLAVAPLLMLWCLICVPIARRAASASATRIIAVCLGLALTCTFLGLHKLGAKLVAAQRSDTWAITAIWDLQALSVATRVNLIPPSISANTDIADLNLSFDPTNAVSLYARSRAQWANSTTGLTPQQSQELVAAWVNAVRAEPLKYANHRLRVFLALLGAVDRRIAGTRIEPVQTPFKDNPPRQFWSEAGIRYWQKFSLPLSGYWLASPLATIIVAASVVVVGLIRLRVGGSIANAPLDRHHQLFFAQATCASGAIYLFGLLPTVPTADMRYAFWPIVAFVLTAVFISTIRSSTVAAASLVTTKPAS